MSGSSAGGLPNLSTLCELRLSRCAIGDAAGAALVAALATNARVRVLDVSGNALGEASAEAFRATLERNETLSFLDLSNNAGFGAKAAETFAAALKNAPGRRPTLSPDEEESDDEEHSEHSDESLIYASAVGLTYLSLAGNGLRERGGAAVAEALATHATLRDVDLARTRCGPRTALALADAVLANRALRIVRLDGCPIGEEAAARLFASAARASAARREERGGGGGGVSILASGIRTEDAPGDLVANARRRDEAAAAALAASRAKKPKASKASKAKGGKAGKGAPGGSASSNLPTLVSKFPADPDAHGGFDRDAPDGIYRLDLANPIDRDVATRVFLLDEERAPSGGFFIGAEDRRRARRRRATSP